MARHFVRRMQSKDVDAVLGLARALHDLHSREDFDEAWKRAWMERFENDANCLALVSGRQGIEGYLFAEIRGQEFDGSRCLYVRELFVRGDSRGKGVGAELIEEAVYTGKMMGAAFAALNVRTGNTAHEFFKKVFFADFSREMRRNL
jgi:GNAT superfamily N-acetyltransferase